MKNMKMIAKDKQLISGLPALSHAYVESVLSMIAQYKNKKTTKMKEGW